MTSSIRRRILPWSGLSLVVMLLVAVLGPTPVSPPVVRAVTTTFSNPASVSIQDNHKAIPYPSQITVSGVSVNVSKVTATLKGFTHHGPDDVTIVITSPTGTTVRLMSHVGGPLQVNGLTLTFDDAALGFLPDETLFDSGTYRPTDGSQPPLDPPLPDGGPPGPYNQTLASFNGASPNGIWSLYAYDSVAGNAGDINNGWSLTFNSPTAIGDAVTTGRDAPIVIPVLANDSDPDGSLDPATVAVVSGPTSGGVSVNPSTGTITYAPLPGYTGSDSFIYTVKDNDGAISNSALVNVTVSNQLDLSIAKTDGLTSAPVGSTVTYSLVVSNAGPSTAIGATVVDALPPELTGVTWTCTPASGGTCTLSSGSGSIAAGVSLPPGATTTFAVTGTVAATGSNSLANAASVLVPAGLTDTNPSNNTAQDTDTIPATSTPTGTPTATATATPTSTPVIPGLQATATAEPVRVSVQRGGVDRLLVRIAAAGPIAQVTWPTVPNVAVETSNGVPITGGSLAPPPGSTTAVFYVRKLSGTSATLPLTVTGAFPTWQTFVGGGPSAW
jgi:uncharacterized repeat protein (TIGR01451 family)